MKHTTGEATADRKVVSADRKATFKVMCEYCDAITTGEVVYDYDHDGEVIPVLVRVHHRCI